MTTFSGHLYGTTSVNFDGEVYDEASLYDFAEIPYIGFNEHFGISSSSALIKNILISYCSINGATRMQFLVGDELDIPEGDSVEFIIDVKNKCFYINDEKVDFTFGDDIAFDIISVDIQSA